MGKMNEKPTRFYPENVKCYPLECNHNKIKYCLKGLFANKKGYSIYNNDYKKTLMNLYIYGRNVEIFKKIRKIIIKEEIVLDNPAIYSYWLTFGISTIKLRYFINDKTNYMPVSLSRGHRYDLYSEINRYNYQPLQDEAIRLLDFVCPCSDTGTVYLKKKYPNQSHKIITCRLGTRYHEDYKVKHITKKKLFVTCSGLRPVKRLDLFAKGFALASKKHKDIVWVCIGDGVEKNSIYQIVEKENISDKVLFLGNMTNDNVYDYYKNNFIYCFVNVSSSEGIPVSIMEAASYGIPVIATDVGGTSEIVDTSNGILLNKDCTSVDICKAIANICNLSDNDYSIKRQCSRKKWEQKFSAEVNYFNWINRLINKKDG